MILEFILDRFFIPEQSGEFVFMNITINGQPLALRGEAWVEPEIVNLFENVSVWHSQEVK